MLSARHFYNRSNRRINSAPVTAGGGQAYPCGLFLAGPLAFGPEKLEIWGWGLGFPFFGLRFSRLPRRSLLDMTWGPGVVPLKPSRPLLLSPPQFNRFGLRRGVLLHLQKSDVRGRHRRLIAVGPD